MGRPYRLALSSTRTLILGSAPGVHPPDPYAATIAAAIRVRKGDRALDLGCGAGGYGLAALARGARHVVFTDISSSAVACALVNAARNGLTNVEGRVGPLLEPVRGELFDIVITSLPQLPAPRSVIETRYGGPDGLRYLRRLAARAGTCLTPAGKLYLLVTDWAYPARVVPLFERQGFAVRRAVRVERAFQPAEYERISPGLFAYLDRRARMGLAAYRRKGRWCYLGVSLWEARLRRGGSRGSSF